MNDPEGSLLEEFVRYHSDQVERSFQERTGHKLEITGWREDHYRDETRLCMKLDGEAVYACRDRMLFSMMIKNGETTQWFERELYPHLRELKQRSRAIVRADLYGDW